MALPVSFTTFIGLATRKVPSAAPQMMTTSQGWISTSMWPPMAMKPPSTQPSVTTSPIRMPTAGPFASRNDATRGTGRALCEA